jgi:thiol-disulfide isomerase/thioredoxin
VADINNYLAAKTLKLGAINAKVREDYVLDETAFKVQLATYENNLKTFLNDAVLDADFTAKEVKNIEYGIIDRKMKYEMYHQYFTNNNDFKVSEAFNKDFENIDFKNEMDFSNIPSYNELASNYFLTGELSESVERLKTTESQIIRDKIIKDLSQWISPGTENLGTLVGDMKNMTKDTTVIKVLDSKYAEMKDLARGNASPGFNFANVSGQMVSLDDLKGKNVYIDIWATWCGPCKREIPFLKDLESQYKGKNIEFVSISVDEPKDHEKWKQMVTDQELKGIQLISDNGWNTDFVSKFLIRGIPRFILLDDSGKIVSADAPRPSSNKKIMNMIETLNI